MDDSRLQPPREDCLGREDDCQLEQGDGSDGDEGGQEVAQVRRPQLSLDQTLHQTPARIGEHA